MRIKILFILLLTIVLASIGTSEATSFVGLGGCSSGGICPTSFQTGKGIIQQGIEILPTTEGYDATMHIPIYYSGGGSVDYDTGEIVKASDVRFHLKVTSDFYETYESDYNTGLSDNAYFQMIDIKLRAKSVSKDVSHIPVQITLSQDGQPIRIGTSYGTIYKNPELPTAQTTQQSTPSTSKGGDDTVTVYGDIQDEKSFILQPKDTPTKESSGFGVVLSVFSIGTLLIIIRVSKKLPKNNYIK